MTAKQTVELQLINQAIRETEEAQKRAVQKAEDRDRLIEATLKRWYPPGATVLVPVGGNRIVRQRAIALHATTEKVFFVFPDSPTEVRTACWRQVEPFTPVTP